MSQYYKNETKRPSPLTVEQEAELFANYQRRRTPAKREVIVIQYLYWAAEIACRYCGPRMPKEDAISAANLGLMQAIEDFDPTLGRKFVTHSFYHIRRTVLNALRETYVVNPASGVNVARHQFNLSKKTEKDRRDFTAAKRKVFDASAASVQVDKFRASGDDCHDSPVMEIACEVEGRDPVEQSSMLDFLRDKIVNMQNPEKKILTLRYLSEDTPLFKEIGQRMKMTEDHVRYLHNRAMDRLREQTKREL